jgi:hypothetical protein
MRPWRVRANSTRAGATEFAIAPPFASDTAILVRLLFGLFFTFMLAAFIGLGATWYVTTRGVPFGGVTIGPWTARPKTGSTDIDPYSRAVIARSGELPLGSGDGVMVLARGDDAGRPLDGRCDVTVDGITPLARYWTLTLYELNGRPVGNAVGRYGFTSREILRRADGSFAITIAPRARPGNWLPSGGVQRYQLALRLYDTPVGVASRSGRETPLPSITSGACP